MMSGYDGFCWLLGVSAVIIAIAFAFALPEALRTVERVLAAEREARSPKPRPATSNEPPWGSRP